MKPLSPTNILNALLFPVLLLFILPILILAGVPEVSNPVIAVILFTILISWIAIGANETYDLHYDDEFLYLNSILGRKKIPLEAIEKIQRSKEGMIVRGVTSWHYEINFYTYTKMKKQSINEVHGGRKVPEFVDAVRKKNSLVLVQLS